MIAAEGEEARAAAGRGAGGGGRSPAVFRGVQGFPIWRRAPPGADIARGPRPAPRHEKERKEPIRSPGPPALNLAISRPGWLFPLARNWPGRLSGADSGRGDRFASFLYYLRGRPSRPHLSRTDPQIPHVENFLFQPVSVRIANLLPLPNLQQPEQRLRPERSGYFPATSPFTPRMCTRRARSRKETHILTCGK